MAGRLDAESAELAAFVSGLDYTMLLVTARHEGRRSGCLVGFATQTSIGPSRLLVCLSRNNATTALAAGATHLAVHQIAADQLALLRLFGEQSEEWTDKFDRCAWADGPHGAPILDGCPAWLVGEVVARLDVGDHEGFLLAPVAAARTRDASALRFADLPPLSPGHEA